MAHVFIGVGSNLGNREDNIAKARLLALGLPNTRLIQSSMNYETDPVGCPDQGKFMNAVWEIETSLAPRELLGELLKIEKALGRERAVKNGPRTIDLDILFYEGEIIREKGLEIPHPRLRERWFALKPLWDIASDFVDPVSGKSVCELLDHLKPSPQPSPL